MRLPGAWFDEERDGYLYGLMRLLLGVLLCFQTYKTFATAERSGYFGNYFHLPVVPASWVPPEPLYFTLLGVSFLGGVLAVSGFGGRAGLLAASLIGIYLLACNRLHYHNNRFSVFLVALLCAFTPCNRSFLLYRGRRHGLDAAERVGPVWARRLIQLQVSAIYLVSSTGKLFDPDWRTGVAMLPRFQQGLAYLSEGGGALGSWLADVLTTAWSAELLSKAAIGTELFLALALWFRRTRVPALWVGFAFHLGIELNARVQLFSWLMGVAYIAFVTPETRERELRFDAGSRAARFAARSVAWLDWLARFRLVEVSGAGTTLAVVSREGTAASGLEGLAALARALPVLFPLWPLLAGVARLRRRFARTPR